MNKKSITFAVSNDKDRNVAQLVAHYVRDVGVGRSSRLIPTEKGATSVPFFCRMRQGLLLFCYRKSGHFIPLAALRDRSHPPGSPQMYCTIGLFILYVFCGGRLKRLLFLL